MMSLIMIHIATQILTSPQKIERLQKLHVQSKLKQQKIKRMTLRLEKAVESRGLLVGQEFHQDLVTIMKENNDAITRMVPFRGSFEKCSSKHLNSRMLDP